jgi:leucyl aminopeptidase
VLAIGIGSLTPRPEAEEISLGGCLLEAMVRHRIHSVQLPPGDVLGGPETLANILLGVQLHGLQCSSSESIGALRVVSADESLVGPVRARAEAINRVRAWIEQPANLLTPPVWADQSRRLFLDLHASVQLLGPAELEKMGAHALLAVGRGSEHGARLLAVEWRGDTSRTSWDAVLVGKGLTFDSGGLNLKPRPGIGKMKLDMAGGAAVLGALELAIARNTRANLVALVPMAENAIDALAFRPGDIITSLSGLTIEVADTDAEGRLVLADAITYGIQTYAPEYLIDAATLTTAITSVLHEEFAGLYASDAQLARGLVEAGAMVGERLWQMPLDESQDYLIESALADVSNLGAPGYFGKGEGSPTAGAKFLQRFARGTRWAHIDLCGTAWASRRTQRSGKGATGYGAALLDRWVAVLEQERAR